MYLLYICINSIMQIWFCQTFYFGASQEGRNRLVILQKERKKKRLIKIHSYALHVTFSIPFISDVKI